jgi:response regulator of citrate/malate metabolism
MHPGALGVAGVVGRPKEEPGGPHVRTSMWENYDDFVARAQQASQTALDASFAATAEQRPWQKTCRGLAIRVIKRIDDRRS